MKIESLLSRLFIVIVSTIISFLVVDRLSLHFLNPRTPFEQKYPVKQYRSPMPYTMFGGKPNGKGLNRLGYKGKAPSLSKKENEYRIFMLGGSTVLNGAPPISKLLEERLHTDGFSNTNVYNFGVVSSVSTQELVRIVLEISDSQPDLIIMYNGGNDIQQPWQWDPRPGYPFNFIVYENHPLLESNVKTYPTAALLAYGSNILRYLLPGYFVERFAPLGIIRKEAGWGEKDWREKIAHSYVKNIIKASKISKAFGSDLMVFFQPMVYFKRKPTDEEKEWMMDITKRNHVLDVHGKILSQVKTIDNENILRFFDLSGIFIDTTESVFIDTIHTRQKSKKHIADEVFMRVADHITSSNK